MRKLFDRKNPNKLISMSRIIPTFWIFQGKKKKAKKMPKAVMIFDLVVAITLLTITGVFLYSKFTKQSTWVEVRVLISDDNLWWSGDLPEYWLIDELYEGQKSYNSFGEEVASIVNKEVFTRGGPVLQAYFDLKMKATFDKKRQIFLFNYQPLQKGKPLDLTFGRTSLQGLVVGINSDLEKMHEKKIRVRMQYLEDWLANAYQPGLEWRDSKGRLLARIDEARVEDTNMYNLSFLNNGIQRNNVIFKDVYLDITVSAFEGRDGELRFVDGAAFKVGDEIWFHFPNVTARTQIVEILQ